MRPAPNLTEGPIYGILYVPMGVGYMLTSLISGVFLTLMAIKLKYVALVKHQIKSDLQKGSIYF